MRLVKFFLVLITFHLTLFAKVILQSPNDFVKGEPFIFKFEALGDSVKFPKIEKIDGYIVESLGTSKSLQIINGDYSEKIIKRFKLVPKESFIIPSFTFVINGEEIKTKSKQILAKTVSKTTSKNFDLALKASKSELYVGEELIIKLIFKYKKGLQITNLGFEQPHFNNFWYEKVDNSSKRYEVNDYVVQELDFLLFPQKSGELKINPLRVDVEMMDTNSRGSFSFFTVAPKLEKIYSNELIFNVKELPSGVNLIGNFNIKASIDKSKVKEGESISYVLNIDGVGNFDDIQDIRLDINDATVYDNKPEIKTNYTKNAYEGVYKKVFSIVPSRSLEIPSITLKYFSKEQKKVIEKKTKSFRIEVENQKKQKVVLQKPKAEKKVEKEKVVITHSLKDKIVYFVLGIVFTLLIIGLYTYVKLQRNKSTKKEKPLVTLVRKSKDKSDMMKILAPFVKKDAALDELIFQCQSQKDFKILKKEILALLKDLKI